jgi:acetamidase/formamidase
LLVCGAILAFPVHARGGLPYVGDCHATQGDGELPGVTNERRTTATLQVNVFKGPSSGWPGLEMENHHMAIGNVLPLEDAPLEDALPIACREPVGGTSAGHGFDEFDVYLPFSQAGRIRFGNMVDPKMSTGASISKKCPV